MVAVFVLDRHKRCKFINAVAEFLTGVPLRQAAGRPFQELVWRGTPYTFEQSHLARALGSDHAEEGEASLSDNTGAKRPFAFRVVPLDTEGVVVVELFDLGGETGAARALRESERRLRLATEATGIGIWDVNAVTGQRRWSAEFVAMLGLAPDTVPSTELFSSLIHPDDREATNALYAGLYERPGDGHYSAEFRIRRADDGRVRWLAATGLLTYDADGRPLRGVGTLRDISAQREHQAAILASEERLRVALLAGRMGLWRHDLETQVQEWDDIQREILGVGPDEPATYERFMALVHPDDAAKMRIEHHRPPVGRSLNWEFRIIRPDGEVRWIAGNGIARADEHGTPIELVGVNRDITDQKKAALALRVSEERLRLTVEANEIGTWDFDMVSGEHQWSSQYKQLWGLPDSAPSDPELTRPLMDPADWEAMQKIWDEASNPASGIDRVTYEYQVRRADTGERRWFNFLGNIFYDAERTRAVRAVGILLDTTSRREVEERRRRVLMEMHHRVNNNLAVVQAILSQTLRTARKPADAFERFQSRLMCLARVHDLLGRSEWSEAPLQMLIAQEIEFVGASRERFTMHGDPVVLDATAAVTLGLVFHELANNALRYGALSHATGHIDVAWRKTGDGDGRVDVSWQERGGPTARMPAREGFGFRIIKSGIAETPGGRATVSASEGGLTWDLGFPLRPPVPNDLALLAVGASR